MISLQLNDIGRKFGSHWLFRHVSMQLQQGDKLAVLGKNGSGKSTLLHLISGSSRPTEGDISFYYQGKKIDAEKLFRYIAWTGPYIELIEEYTAKELAGFCNEHKPFIKGYGVGEILEYAMLKDAADLYIKNFSSGMKQRLRLALAVFSDVPFLFLDEPLSNLDADGGAYFKRLMDTFTGERIVIICSNHLAEETASCNRTFSI